MEESKMENNPEEIIRDNVRYYGMQGREAISARIQSLEEERDLDKTFTTVAAGLGFFGLVIGLLGGKAFRIFTWVSLPMLLLNSLGKWVPPVEGLRRMGFRTRRDIEAEKYALKALRGDFKQVVESAGPEVDAFSERTAKAFEAVKST